MPGGVIGLQPEYPPVGPLFHFGYEFVQVDSLWPTFRWEAFPRQRDLAVDIERNLGHLTAVAYDLEIWRAGDNVPFGSQVTQAHFPSERVYVKRGLPEAFHRIEQPLAPSTMYFWTIRARFQVNGEPRVTDWGMYERGYTELRQRFDDLRPNPLYFRFATPSR